MSQSITLWIDLITSGKVLDHLFLWKNLLKVIKVILIKLINSLR